MATTSTLRATSLRLLIVCVVLSALLGVIALLGGTSAGMAKVLVSSLCGTAASLLAFLGATGLEREGWRWVGTLAIVASLVGFGLVVLGTWGEARSELLWKVSALAIVTGTAAGHAVLLQLARLRHEHAWVRRLTHVFSVVLAMLLCLAVLGEVEDGSYYRAVGCLAVLVAAGTLIVPILARAARAHTHKAHSGLGAIARYCPACGQGIEPLGDPLACGACGASFRVSFEGASASPFQ